MPSGSVATLNAPVDDAPIEDLSLRCDHGNAKACAEAAHAFQWGKHGVKKDEAKDASFRRRACELGDWDSCALFASSLGLGLGVAKDVSRAFRLSLRACHDGKVLFACDQAATWLTKPPNVLGHHEPEAFDLALEGQEELTVVEVLTAWMKSCGADTKKAAGPSEYARAVTECAHILDSNAPRLRTMELPPEATRENVDDELKSVCSELIEAIPERPSTPFEWPKTCSNLGIDAPPPPPPPEPQPQPEPTGPSE